MGCSSSVSAPSTNNQPGQQASGTISRAATNSFTSSRGDRLDANGRGGNGNASGRVTPRNGWLEPTKSGRLELGGSTRASPYGSARGSPLGFAKTPLSPAGSTKGIPGLFSGRHELGSGRSTRSEDAGDPTSGSGRLPYPPTARSRFGRFGSEPPSPTITPRNLPRTEFPRTETTKVSGPILTAVGRDSPNSSSSQVAAMTDDSGSRISVDIRSDSSSDVMGSTAAALRAGRNVDIALSSDDDEGGGRRPFDMQQWKRFYHYNSRKPEALLPFFWKHFELGGKTWSLFCCAYRNQDALFAPFQGENVIHGAACRLEAACNESGGKTGIFGLLHTFSDREAAHQKVLGLFIVRGRKPPPELALVLDEHEWALVRVDATDSQTKDFISKMLAPRAGPPLLHEFTVMCSRELR